jgi:hypothetical protein
MTLSALMMFGCQSRHTVGGTVTGLKGTLVLGLGTQRLTIQKDGAYTFPDEVAEGTAYQVLVQGKPALQACNIANGHGVMPQGGQVTNVNVTCSDINPNAYYSISVQVTGLKGDLVLLDNGTDALTIHSDGVYPFATKLQGGAVYEVTVSSQPTNQACQVQGGLGQVGNTDVTDIVVSCGQGFALSGVVTYDFIPAVFASGQAKLNYAAKVSKPVRRAQVQLYDTSSAQTVAGIEAWTKDDGSYSISVPSGIAAKIWVRALSRVAAYTADGIGQDTCQGSGWDVRVEDNTSSEADYVMVSNDTFTAANNAANLNAATLFNGSTYTTRTGAPFALLDTAISEIELVCEGNPAVQLPTLKMLWSDKNTNTSGNVATGLIGTSFYSTNANSPDNTSRLYILGKQDVDTDEYDNHVVAHEFGHFIEDRLFRSDSVGGPHSDGDVLMPSLAFSEGYGNSISGMVFNDPVYVDTNGPGQASGFDLDVSQAPSGNDRGVYSEMSSGYLLWSLYENRDGTPHSGSFDRLFVVLGDQAVTPALTSSHAFAALYKARYAEAESLYTLWNNDLASPWNALCGGTCCAHGTCTVGADNVDVFDVDNDLGIAYAAAGRNYPPGTATTPDAEFWRLFRTIGSGTVTPNGHDVIAGYGNDPTNEFGYVRAYRFVGTGQSTTVTVTSLGGGLSCSTDLLDLFVLKNGVTVTSDQSGVGVHAGCPTVTFGANNGQPYVLLLLGVAGPVPSWTMTVSP